MKKWKELFSSALFRVIVIILAVVIPLNLLTLALGRRVMAQAERLVSRETEATLELVLRQLDDALDWADRNLALLSMDDADFRRLASREIDGDEEYYRQVQCVVELSRNMKDRMESNSLLTGIFIYFPEKDWFLSSASGARSTQVQESISSLIKAGEGESFAGGRPLTVDGRSVLLKLQERRGGWCGSWVELRELAALIPAEEGHLLAFTGADGTVYYPAGASWKLLDPSWERCTLDGRDYLPVRGSSAAAGLTAVELLPKREISGALPAAIRMMQILSVASLALLPLLMIAMQRWMIAPVGKLTEAMEHIEAGELNWRIQSALNGSEFERINRNFNNMMDQVSELKISLYEEQLKAQKIKMGFLAQQIRPHFILNALNILYSYEPEEYALSQRMILCLSKYFRYVVNASMDFVPLGRELEHLRNYFEIQQARFRRNFRAGVVCGGDAEFCLIPPLLVQSFAENAIKHAFTPGEVIDITVMAQRTGNRVLISVADTGAGIPDEVLERIEEFRGSHEFRRDLGVGIQNSIDRLEILYADRAELRIFRAEPRGTRVEIEVPYLREEGREDERDTG